MRDLVISLLLLFVSVIFSDSAHAAWPDSSPSRVEALKLLRVDLGSGASTLEGSARNRLFARVCAMKKTYRPICKSQKWTRDGRADIALAGNYFGQLCRSKGEPLACVVSAWYDGFVDGAPSKKARNPRRAVASLTKACTKKAYGPACAYLADFYAAGIGAPRNIKAAMRRYKEACKAKDDYACARIGTMMMYGQGIEQDVLVGEENLEAGCDQGMGQFCAELGVQYLMGVGVEKSPYVALDYFEKGCKKKDGRSCQMWATELIEIGGEDQELANAFGYLTQACKQGVKRSCDMIKKSHSEGLLPDSIQIEGPGFITISADSNAMVFIDGKFVRNVPLFRHKLTYGKHRVHLVHKDGRAKKFGVDIRSGTDHAYNWSFKANRWATKNKTSLHWPRTLR